MGALIHTKGTRRLMNFYNSKCFDKNSIGDLRSKADLMAAFAAANSGTPRVYEICEQFSDILYPKYSADHPHLLGRWRYYLQNVLGNQLNEKLRACIYDGLSKKDGAGNYFYKEILCDCVEAPNGYTKDVLCSDEFRLKGGDTDDSAIDTSNRYKRIVLLTDAMPISTPGGDLDNQGGP